MLRGANKIISSTFAATIMKIGYGIAVLESDDPYISIAEEAVTGAAEAGIPGAFLVDLFPILRYVPSWFPGAGFQKKAARVREATNIMAEKPFRLVQEQLVQFHFLGGHNLLLKMILQIDGKATPSVAASLIERLPDEGDPQRSREERVAKDVVFVAYIGAWYTWPIFDVPLTSLSPLRGLSQLVLTL
jgi:hypothetical protein